VLLRGIPNLALTCSDSILFIPLSDCVSSDAMGVFADLFSAGNRPLARVSVIEAFAENPEETFTAPDVIRMTGVSRRATYYIIESLVREGLLTKTVEKTGRRKLGLYSLNNSDLRATVLKQTEALLAIGKIEAQIKIEHRIPSTEMLPMSLLSRPIVAFMLETPTIEVRSMNELPIANNAPALPSARSNVKPDASMSWAAPSEQTGWKAQAPCT